ncbi:MAG: HepT-like ribonuclease domain-containing protein [Thermoleophilia bacterium]
MSDMQPDDVVRIRHMYDAAIEAQQFVAGKTRSDLDDSRMLALSLLKEIEIIGEAASRVSEAARKGLPLIPWQDITAMRNRLIHAYFDIDLAIVWDTVTQELPQLINELEQILELHKKE